MENIIIQTTIAAPLQKVWELWTKPEHIIKWNAASEDWHTPRATNDLRTGGKFTARMEAKDGSMGFDFGGTYNEVKENELISYTMDDGRTVQVTFAQIGDSVTVTESFDPESENSREMQEAGWQSILNNFKKYVENQR